MVQQIIIWTVFAGAILWLGRMAYRSFQSKHACASGCAKCGAIDFQKIEQEIARANPKA